MSPPRLLPGSAMDELVKASRLKRVDVLLTHTKGSLLGWLIRFGTRSYWNHAAMVYVLWDPSQGYESTFIIESGGAGIDIHNISHYLERPGRADVGIKRLDRPWFQDDRPQGGLNFQRRIRGFALEEIDDSYDFRMILGLARRILRQMILALLFPWLRLRPAPERRLRPPRLARTLDIKAYICSGFIQWSYYQGVKKVLEEEGQSLERLEEVAFSEETAADPADDVLLSTTPADLANSGKLAWKFVVKDGEVWEVSSDADVHTVLRSSAPAPGSS